VKQGIMHRNGAAGGRFVGQGSGGKIDGKTPKGPQVLNQWPQASGQPTSSLAGPAPITTLTQKPQVTGRAVPTVDSHVAQVLHPGGRASNLGGSGVSAPAPVKPTTGGAAGMAPATQ
jgi:hypothetical protein